MRKPVSKHALRKALEQVRAQGIVSWETPTGTVVDQLWHHIEKTAFNGTRKKPVTRETVRRTRPAEALEV
jgi:DNA-binding FadR family transcriptional regulator